MLIQLNGDGDRVRVKGRAQLIPRKFFFFGPKKKNLCFLLVLLALEKLEAVLWRLGGEIGLLLFLMVTMLPRTKNIHHNATGSIAF